MKVDYKKIGNQIRVNRRRNNWTQAQLAEMVDVGTRHINCIENGAKKMSLALLIKIAYTFNVSLDVLIDGSVIF